MLSHLAELQTYLARTVKLVHGRLWKLLCHQPGGMQWALPGISVPGLAGSPQKTRGCCHPTAMEAKGNFHCSKCGWAPALWEWP